ncbi:GDSL-type esterase/lipase family protein [Chitinophaga sp. RAB17]|uniref:GDSL-type esterase/lipase family protein n=1 Tax=Chitinophaga sp. RAB17 TaxID=3233049 RepID=UPI003F9226F4
MKKFVLLALLLIAAKYCYPQNCSNPLRIVVLGSSTAWGNGLPSRDSAWTFRFARYLKANHHPADTVINLAVGGFTTQNIQATGTPPYTVLGTTFTVDVNKNITRAIALLPDAIIVNISNDDEGRGFPLSVQVANFLALKQAAAQANIPLWVTTTQPRDNLGTAGAGRLLQMKDSITFYFGDKAIDFWTGLASGTNQIAAAYSAGDGFHFNSAGQQILFDRVFAKQIPQSLCTPSTPVFQLTSFAVTPLKDSLQLKWTTAREVKSKYFAVERSTDSLNWGLLSQVTAAGSSTATRTYTLTDVTFPKLPTYYRLDMVDSADGHTYSAAMKGIPDTLYYTPFLLSTFTLNSLPGKIKLDWNTLLESNTLTFTVERSIDSLTWVAAGNVTAAGNATTPRNYSYTDNTVTPNQPYFYRLNMEATGSRHSYSTIVKGQAANIPANCSSPLRIVVLGSSTAWGNALPSRDSAWAFRFARYLKASHNPSDTVINLAVGGYTTQNIQATGTSPYTVLGSTFSVDVNKNITRAIALLPDAIIINISNDDEGRGFPLAVQLANFLALRQVAAQANIPLWVTTTQPRDNLGTAGAGHLKQMKDSITVYFGDKAIDFWTGLTSATNQIAAAYSAGDGFHFNSAGQQILFDRVVAKQIPQALCTPSSTAAFQLTSFSVNQWKDSLQLKWATAREVKSKYFAVEQSADSLNWNLLSQVTAAGNSAANRTYSIMDATFPRQPKYYRLNMVDSSDAHTYSAVVKGIPDTLYYTPFRLSAFAPTSLPGKIKLDWSTQLESNTLTFTVERSTDSLTWTATGNVAAAGNSATLQHYAYTDNTVTVNQLYFYRLNMTATGNRHFYSTVVKSKADNISPNCGNPLRIVVLGSSTAYGDGLPTRDSAWTFRFARYLKASHNAADTVINLAIGGYTTQHIMPDGTAPYTSLGNTFYVDVQHNITRALSLNPDAIIINMPTNDEARGFPLAKQTANYLALKQLAAQSNVPLWVTTTQPRGNLGYDAAIRLRQMRDTIIAYFGNKSIDFYNGLATSIGFIVPAYNSGDDVHFNSLGQSILFDRVVAADLPDSLCMPAVARDSYIMTTPKISKPEEMAVTGIRLYPNPASDYVLLQGMRGKVYKVEVYTTQGALVYLQDKATGNRLDISRLRAGIYFVIVNSTQRFKLVKL